MAKRRRRARKPITLDQLRASMSTAARELESIYLNDIDPDRRIRAINSMAALSNAYKSLTDSADLEKRIEALEAV